MSSLKSLLALSLLPALQGVSASSSCRCVPGDDCWPSNDDWNDFNSTLDGRLIRTVPPASVCYPDEPNHDPETCQTVLSEWIYSSFHGQDPASINYPFWADTPCPPIFPNGTSVTGDTQAGAKGCTIGKYPAFVVNATTPEHIASTVQWAKERNVRLNIKNTGHSHLGRSTAYGSLS